MSPSRQVSSQVPSEPTWVYEEAVTRIEAIIERIEAGDLPLAEVFDQFAQAMQQLHQCETFLTQQQQRMDVLIETLTDGDAEP